MGNKGFQYERDVSKKLSLWWTNGEDDGTIWRTSQSGGRATTRTQKGKKTKYQYGDLTFVDPIAKPFFDMFLVECKRGYSKNPNNKLDVLDCLDIPTTTKKTSILFDWWDKALLERDLGDRKEVFIIIKRDRRLPVVALRHDFLADIEFYCKSNFKEHFIRVGYDIELVLLDDFLGNVTPETIHMMLRN